ncbi:MAG: secretin N-terminal domain-containing protein [Planctomycetota bacterium]|jgi:type II secretory pathway component GspD/PulD (secretin)
MTRHLLFHRGLARVGRLAVGVLLTWWLLASAAVSQEPPVADPPAPTDQDALEQPVPTAASGQTEESTHDAIRRLGLASLADPDIAQRLELTDEQKARVAQELQNRNQRLAETEWESAYLVYAEAERRLARVLDDRQWTAWEQLSSGAPDAEASPAAAETPAVGEPSVPRGPPAPASPPAPEATTPAEAEPEPTEAGEPEPSATDPEAQPGEDPAATAAAEPPQPGEATEGETSEAAPSESLAPSEGDAAQATDDEAEVTEDDIDWIFGDDSEKFDPAERDSPPRPRKLPDTLTFSFEGETWEEVLKWFARQAGMILVYESFPHGTCNYVDDQVYTPGQGVNVINGLLLLEGYVLFRRERLLILWNLEEEIPPDLIEEIPVEELDNRGEYELVAVRFPLESLTAEEANTEVKDLVGREGSVAVLSKSRQILARSTVGRLRMVRDTLRRVEETGAASTIRTFPLDFTTAENDLLILKQLMTIPAEENTSSDKSITLMWDSLGMRLVAAGELKKIEQVAKALEALQARAAEEAVDEGVESAIRVDTYPCSPADPETVLKVMQTLLENRPSVRASTDPNTGNLIIMGPDDVHALVKKTLELLIRDATRIHVFELRTMDPQKAMTAIQNLIPGEGSTLKIAADPTTNQLIVRGSEGEIALIRSWLDQMGETGTSTARTDENRHFRVVPIPGAMARSLLDRTELFWSTMRPNKIREVTPAADTTPMMRFRVPAGASSLQDFLIQPPYDDQGYGAPMPLRPSAGVPGTGSPTGEVPAPQLPATPLKAPESAAPAPVSPEPKPAPPKQTPTARASGRIPVRFVAQAAEPETPAAESQEEPPAAEAGQEPPPAEPVVTEPTQAPGLGGEKPMEAETAPADAAASQPQGGPADLVVGVVPGGIMVASEDADAVDAFVKLLNTLAGSGGMGADGPPLTVFYLRHAKASEVASTLTTILANASFSTATPTSSSGSETSSGILLGASSGIAMSGPVRLDADDRLNMIIAQGNPADMDTVEQLLKILDQGEGPQGASIKPQYHLIQLYYTNAEEVAEIVKTVFQSRMITGSGGNQQQRGGGGQMSPQQMFMMMRSRGQGGAPGGTRGGGQQRGTPASQDDKMSIGVDARTNTLIVWANELLFREVSQMVRDLDDAAFGSNNEAMVAITLDRSNPEAVGQALSALLGDSVTVETGGSTSSRGSTSTRRPSSGTSRTSRTSSNIPDDVRRRIEAFRAMRGQSGFQPGGMMGRGMMGRGGPGGMMGRGFGGPTRGGSGRGGR